MAGGSTCHGAICRHGRAVSIVAVIALADVLDHAIGGWAGFLAGFAVALAAMLLAPTVWRLVRR